VIGLGVSVLLAFAAFGFGLGWLARGAREEWRRFEEGESRG
jgi:hypothetical protein